MVDDAFERGNDAREKLGEFAAGDENVVDFEKHAEAVAFARELLLIGLRSFEVEGVVHCDSHLAGNALHELQLGVSDAVRNHAAEAHGAKPMLRRG